MVPGSSHGLRPLAEDRVPRQAGGALLTAGGDGGQAGRALTGRIVGALPCGRYCGVHPGSNIDGEVSIGVLGLAHDGFCRGREPSGFCCTRWAANVQRRHRKHNVHNSIAHATNNVLYWEKILGCLLTTTLP